MTTRTTGHGVNPLATAPAAAGRDLPAAPFAGPAGSFSTTIAQAIANPPRVSDAALAAVARIMAGYLQRTDAPDAATDPGRAPVPRPAPTVAV